MPDPEDGPADDEQFVRPFALTGGRTRPTRTDLDLTTQVLASGAAPSWERGPLTPEMRQILALCTVPVAIAELASAVALPVTTVTVLVSDLLDRGCVVADAPALISGDRPSIDLLQHVLEGIQRVL